MVPKSFILQLHISYTNNTKVFPLPQVFFHAIMKNMNEPSSNILLIESDPEIQNFIADQTLIPQGFKVDIVEEAGAAINRIAEGEPDLVLIDIDLKGLSGADLLVAIKSQGINIPVIIIAKKGQENRVIQAFRLGGDDYLLWPAQETEIISCIEHALQRVRENRARYQLALDLEEANKKLNRSMEKLTTIISVSKAIVSITDQNILFNKIIEGMVNLSNANYGWLTLREEKTGDYLLASQYRLPEAWGNKLGRPFDDGMGALVALSGETLAINGQAIKRFKVSSLGNSAIVVPIKAKKEVIGLMGAISKLDDAIDGDIIPLVESLADFVSISLVNAHLFKALKESIDKGQKSESITEERLREFSGSMKNHILSVIYPVELMVSEKMGPINKEQKSTLENIQSTLQEAMKIVDSKA
jgi:DNA-binding response OmpR family regulator